MKGNHGLAGRRRRFEALYKEYHGPVLGSPRWRVTSAIPWAPGQVLLFVRRP